VCKVWFRSVQKCEFVQVPYIHTNKQANNHLYIYNFEQSCVPNKTLADPRVNHHKIRPTIQYKLLIAVNFHAYLLSTFDGKS
jgi:hypothetical protein